MASDRATATAIAALTDLADALGSFRLRYVGDDAEAARRRGTEIIERFAVPRLRDREGPLLVAVTGPSGSGKSTLVNSLAHREVSPAGPVRPMTSRPVAWAGERSPVTLDVLASTVDVDLVEVDRPPPDGLAIVDTASAEADGDPAAVIDAADVCVFVTGSSQYADAAGWELIERASDRGMPMVFVLNRLPADADVQRQLVDDFARQLAVAGVADRAGPESVVGIAMGPISRATGGLPYDWVSGLRKEIEVFAEHDVREQIIAAGIARAFRALRAPVSTVRRAIVSETAARLRLTDPVRAALTVETEVLAADLATGAFADLDRERLGADLGAVVARRAGRLSRAVAERWESDPEAAPLLDEAPGVWTHDHATVDRVRSAVAAWVGDLPAIVFQATGARRMWRRRRTMLGAAVLRRVFDPDAELSGREQRLLARAPDAVSAARSLLADELGRALAVDADRFLDLVGQGIPDGVLDRLNVPEAM